MKIRIYSKIVVDLLYIPEILYINKDRLSVQYACQFFSSVVFHLYSLQA